jgi:hypothetical protein
MTPKARSLVTKLKLLDKTFAARVDANLCLERDGNRRFSKNEGIVSAREG